MTNQSALSLNDKNILNLEDFLHILKADFANDGEIRRRKKNTVAGPVLDQEKQI